MVNDYDGLMWQFGSVSEITVDKATIEAIRTAIKVISYKNGNKSKEVYFKSIKQAYDMLQAAGFNLTYKTFQRKCNAEKPSLIETDKMSFYVTKHLDFVGPDTLTV